MTERKPHGVSWESWREQQIRRAVERGEFEDLPGRGKPLPGLDRPRDDLWWVKDKLKRENLSYLPPTLAIRKEREDALERVARARSEAEVREIVETVNARIREVNRSDVKGPPSRVVPLDVERILAEWRGRPRD